MSGRSFRSSRQRSRRGGGGGGEAPGSERWLVSYADLITLLFALFVVLYAMSQADLKKLKAVKEGFRQALTGGRPAGGEQTSRSDSRSGSDSHGEGASAASSLKGAGGAKPRDLELFELRRLLEEAMEFDSSVANTGEETVSGRSTELRWVIHDLYGDGDVEAPLDFWPLLKRVADVLVRYPDRPIRWEGHADLSETQGDSRRAWQLSLQRALWMNELMKKRWAELQKEGRGMVDRTPAEIAAYGATRPLRESELRRKRDGSLTRRVELVILPREKP